MPTISVSLVSKYDPRYTRFPMTWRNIVRLGRVVTSGNTFIRPAAGQNTPA
jgi:hypothetical protein